MLCFGALVIASVMALPALAAAAGVATVQADDKASRIEWLDTRTVRLDQSGEDNYVVLRDGSAYLITKDSNPPRVIDLGDVAQTLNQVVKGLKSPGMDLESKIPTIHSVRDTGNPATVAGIRGETYQVVATDSDGKEQTFDAVLTDNPLVTELTHAYLNVAAALVSGQTAQKLRNALPPDHQGVLKVSGKYQIQSISDTPPDTAKFVLPAAPTSMNDMLQGVAKQLQQLQQHMR